MDAATAFAASVVAERVSVSFPLYHGSARSLKKTLIAAASSRLSEAGGRRVVVHGLDDVSFSLAPGDRLGLIGRNGAGKTTLLRTLAGIYEPNDGHISVHGKISALLDPSLGMNAELTGRENIFVRGMLAGMPQADLPHLVDNVTAFADLAEFIDLPQRIYSAGMVIRLGFALATAIRPQVLLMDEWFLAGDAAFLERAKLRLEDMVRGAEILVLSSHNLEVLRAWCTRIFWMDRGRIREDGPPDEVIAHYLASVSAAPDEVTDQSDPPALPAAGAPPAVARAAE